MECTLRGRLAVAMALILCALFAAPGGADAAITDFPLPGSPAVSDITAGPDGAVWFVADVEGAPPVIGRVSAAGEVTQFPIPGVSSAVGITTGPDGNLWFTAFVNNGPGNNHGRIGRATPAGNIQLFETQDQCCPYRIAAGSDGALWFTESVIQWWSDAQGHPHFNEARLGRMSTNGTAGAYSVGPGRTAPQGIAGGPDGALWFPLSDSIGSMTTAGQVGIAGAARPTGEDIAVGPDGALWFSTFADFDFDGETGQLGEIGRMTTAGSYNHFPYTSDDDAAPSQVAVGPDGAIWFTDTGFLHLLGRMTTSGSPSTCSIPKSYGLQGSITAGPDGGIWFARSHSGVTMLSRVTSMADCAGSTPPDIKIGMGAATFAAAPSGDSVQKAKVPVGSRVTYTVAQASTVRFGVERGLAGRKVGSECRRQTSKNRSAKPCTRYSALKGTFTHDGLRGSNHFTFTGRLRGKALAPGSYRLAATTRGAKGGKSLTRRVAFKIVKR